MYNFEFSNNMFVDPFLQKTVEADVKVVVYLYYFFGLQSKLFILKFIYFKLIV